MEATGNQNVDLNSQFGTIVATHPHLQLNRNSIPSQPLVVHPSPSFARFCESRISSIIWRNLMLVTVGAERVNVPSIITDLLSNF